MSRRILVVSVAGLTPGDLNGPAVSGLGVLRTLAGDGCARPLAPVRPDTPATWSAALLTGRLPDATGITAAVGDPPTTHDRPRSWTAADLPTGGLLAAAAAAGARAAVLGLPLTADPEGLLPVEWLCPDLTDVARWGTRYAMLEACSSQAVRERLPRLRQDIQHLGPETRDDLYADLAVEILEQEAPELTVVHLTELAAARRADGLESSAAHDALRRTDRRVGRLLAAGRRTDEEPPAVLVVSGGVQTEVRRQVNLNAVLKERGFLQASGADRTDGWEAFALTCGATARIVVAQSIQPRRVLQLESLLTELVEQPGSGVETVAARDRLACGLTVDHRTAYLVAGTPGTSFGDSWSKRPVIEADDPYYDGPRAVSGRVDGRSGLQLASEPLVEPQPTSVLDLAPALAELLGTSLGAASS
jgi:hypothetical protein